MTLCKAVYMLHVCTTVLFPKISVCQSCGRSVEMRGKYRNAWPFSTNAFWWKFGSTSTIWGRSNVALPVERIRKAPFCQRMYDQRRTFPSAMANKSFLNNKHTITVTVFMSRSMWKNTPGKIGFSMFTVAPGRPKLVVVDMIEERFFLDFTSTCVVQT